MLRGVTAAVLVGGRGTRLQSVVSDRPKILADVAGRPFVLFLLDQLVDAGVRNAVLCTGYLADQVEAALGHQYGPLTLTHSCEPTPLGTGGALRLAVGQVESDIVLVLNGDSLHRCDLSRFFGWFSQRSSAAGVVITTCDDPRRFGRIEVGDDEKVTRFAEKSSDQTPGWINAGVYLFRRETLLAIPARRNVSLERETLPSLVGDLVAFRSTGPVLDIGTPESYRLAQKELSIGKAR